MDGVQLCARFSIATNRLQFCGPSEAAPILYNAITQAKDIPAARKNLSQFEALMPYLEAIGAKHGLDPFDFRVVEAYWIGNSLLDTFERKDFAALLERLRERGLPKSMVTSLSDRLPERPIPHHMFHVGFVGVGSVTGHVETTVQNMESCRPSWGEVTELEGSSVVLRKQSISLIDKELRLTKSSKASTQVDPQVLPEVHEGDFLALHWGFAGAKLSDEQVANLKSYTDQSLSMVNKSLRS